MQTKDGHWPTPPAPWWSRHALPKGAVLRNQLVGKSMAQVVREQQQAKYPGAIVEEKPVEQAVQERTGKRLSRSVRHLQMIMSAKAL